MIYHNNGEEAMLTYYIGQYIVPAGIGKVFKMSFKSILTVNWLWSALGLILVMLLFTCAAGAKKVREQIFCIVFVVLAGGLMPLQQSIGNILYPSDIMIGQTGWLDYFMTYGRISLQFRTNFISIRWAFGQTIVPWIIIIILYLNRDKVRYYLPLVLPSVLFGTFSSFSIIITAIFLYVDYCCKNKKIKQIIKETFSLENCLSALSLGSTLFIYYIGYITQEKPEGVGFSFVNYFNKDIGIYLIFVLGAFGLYALIIFREYKRMFSYWACVLLMLLLPLIKFGAVNDLLMGACIAPSMLLYVLIARWLFEQNQVAVQFRKGIMITLLMISFIKPSLELFTCIRDFDYTEYVPNDVFVTMEHFANRYGENVSMDVIYNYYTYDAYDSLFMKTIGENTNK